MEVIIMEERKNVVTFQGEPLTLLGKEIKVGDKAPSFTGIQNNLQPVSPLEAFKGKVLVISVMPSVDTPVCELQTIRFDKEAEAHKDIHIVTISEDLPFALSKFCGHKAIKHATTLSDYMTHEFGEKYGFLIKELNLLARGVVVIDPEGIVRHVEYVPEITHEPDYAKVLDVAVHLQK
jgi:thiol peroxidase